MMKHATALATSTCLFDILILNGTKHAATIDVPQPLTNDLWDFLFQTIDAQFVK